MAQLLGYVRYGFNPGVQAAALRVAAALAARLPDLIPLLAGAGWLRLRRGTQKVYISTWHEVRHAASRVGCQDIVRVLLITSVEHWMDCHASVWPPQRCSAFAPMPRRCAVLCTCQAHKSLIWWRMRESA